MSKHFLFFSILNLLLHAACKDSQESVSPGVLFAGKEEVTVLGYTGHLMEPFLSRDGNILMFNNSNSPAENTNVHWATCIDDNTFQYQGEISGANSPMLDGVPTMDRNRNLYFVSLRTYEASLETIHVAEFINGNVSEPLPVSNISRYEPGWVSFDVEVDADGETLYFADGTFDANGGPYASDIIIAKKVDGQFQRHPQSQVVLANVNTVDLEYAASVSSDNLELYFTRATAPLTETTIPKIFVAIRQNINEPFDPPIQIGSISGFAEAPSISPDGNLLYFHGRDQSGKHSLFVTRRSGL